MEEPDMLFLQCILEELGMWCCTSTSLDLKTIKARVEHEGWSFLTITLPEFGKSLENALDQGQVTPDHFAGFRRRAGLPVFLRGFLEQVFDSQSGRLVDVPNIEAIRCLRQLTLMWAKINLPCSPARERAAMQRYVDCEQEVRDADAKASPARVEAYTRIGTLLWSGIFDAVERDIVSVDEFGYSRITPKHGPGAIAERIRGNSKFTLSEWTERLEQVFPSGEHLISSWRFIENLTNVRILEPGAERPVRVVTVPKTLKTPRIIAIEPGCMQYMQQGLLASIGRHVQTDKFGRFVTWESQVPNQHLAREGSRSRALATLDLSEASDRVSNQHVRGLLRNHAFLAEAVDSCRSRNADVHGHGIIPLAKFASMGSALCFPFEAMVFATMIFVGIEEKLSRRLTRKDITSFLDTVRVYGDDIIVPVEYVHSVTEVLEHFGLRVNSRKSFWTGKFRESCGKEYYDGEDVTIVRIRSVFPSSRQHAQEIASTVSTMNQLYRAGLWRSCEYLATKVSKLIPLPLVADTSPVLGRQSFLGYQTDKTDPDTHAPLVRGARLQARLPVDRLEGYGALLKCLTRLEKSDDDIFSITAGDIRHLERAGRPYTVDIKVGWSTPF